MDNQLCQTLGNLRLADDQPDYHARKKNLSRLMKDLTSNEIRLLKQILSQVTLQTDIISRLPLELVLSISNYLDPRDILTCFAISKTWRAGFKSEQVIFALADRVFPSLVYNEPNAGETRLHSDSVVKALCTWTKIAEGRYGIKAMTKYRGDAETSFVADTEVYSATELESMSNRAPLHVSGSPDGALDSVKALYGYGKIAWSTTTDGVVVLDCLRTRSRQIFAASGMRLADTGLVPLALGDKLVVAGMYHYLCGWDIETGTHKRVTLPCQLEDAATIGFKVVVWMTNKEMLIWDFGRSLLPVALPESLLTTCLDNIQCQVHPNSSTVLLNALDASTAVQGSLRYTLYEFSDRKLAQTYCFDLPREDPKGKLLRGQPLDHLGHKFIRADSYGLFTMGGFKYFVDRSETGSISRFLIVQFNVYKKRFSLQYFDIPEIGVGTSNFSWHVWNNQLFVQPDHFEENSAGYERALSTIYQFKSETSATGGGRPGQGREWQELSQKPRSEYVCVHGDDDFLLLLGDREYTSWSFASNDLDSA
ncbi:uncharacterized protein BCR38DRAFT_490813 [Pseudomassariella vexata]|uniref:F-box domain-containing protein n=1 Tax=Pseudomassariella vexata TaxID=1141098 RepID=A0A1Y2DA58_9PEZI|nr:uncharacterized protein BCR38DRAFT_490813 [Pseudomassariella vexata]ORY56158.1 hypothetical protein BCR38DRAFT_490813 [Pseudomassariella vexata]